MSKVAKIYLPTKTAMQSGRGNTKLWVLEFEIDDSIAKSALMGWYGSTNTNRQVKLRFHSCDEAVKYAMKYNLVYRLIPHYGHKIRKKSYASNFIT